MWGYVFISEAAKEIKCISSLLKDVGIRVKLPIVVETDDVRAIFMSESTSTGVGNRHSDTRYYFIRESATDGFIRIEFVQLKKNESDIFTKHVNQETYKRRMKNCLDNAFTEDNGCTFCDRKDIALHSFHIRLYV